MYSVLYFVLEPSILKSNQSSNFHLQAKWQSLSALKKELKKLNIDILVLQTEAKNAFELINLLDKKKYKITFSNQSKVMNYLLRKNTKFPIIVESFHFKKEFFRPLKDKVKTYIFNLRNLKFDFNDSKKTLSSFSHPVVVDI